MVTTIDELERNTADLNSNPKQKCWGWNMHNKNREEVLTKAHFQICSLPFLDLKIGDLWNTAQVISYFVNVHDRQQNQRRNKENPFIIITYCMVQILMLK